MGCGFLCGGFWDWDFIMLSDSFLRILLLTAVLTVIGGLVDLFLIPASPSKRRVSQKDKVLKFLGNLIGIMILTFSLSFLLEVKGYIVKCGSFLPFELFQDESSEIY